VTCIVAAASRRNKVWSPDYYYCCYFH